MWHSRVAMAAVGVLVAGLVSGGRADSAEIGSGGIPGLRGGGAVTRDASGVPHVTAADPRDLFYLQGWAHADDRLFQMDVSRRRGSGTLAELLGASALPADVQMRTLGLRRAAERGLGVLSGATRQALSAYAEGVNAWIAHHQLPGQYAAVQVSQVAPWTVTDSLVVLKALAFSLSFDLDIDRTTAVRAYDAAGRDGQTAVFQDLFPFAPFTGASPVADAGAPVAGGSGRGGRTPDIEPVRLPSGVARMASGYLARASRVPLIEQALNRSGDRGSNAWVISGRHTASGRPILASDPHLGLETPAVFHPIDLRGAGFDVRGDSLPGSPFVILGQNRQIAYAATQHLMDVTDTYVEQIRPDASSPSGLSSVYRNKREPVLAIPETFRVNARTPGQRDAISVVPPGGAIPARTLIVPRRNNGPLLTVDSAAGTALSVQYTGFSGTGELEAFRLFNLARDVNDFRAALQHFDVGGQHFVYADVRGTIAYFTQAEVPVREDLQAGRVSGNPPYLLRDGTGGNEWLPVRHRQPHQAVPYEIVPFAEFPRTVNPPAGFVVSANNDPTRNSFDNDVLNEVRPGGGIAYLGFFHNGFRGGRLTELVRAAVKRGGIGSSDVTAMQADVTAVDARYFTRVVTAALARARTSTTPALRELAGDDRIVAAAGRLGRWDHTYPTGIPEGYDASDSGNRLQQPSAREIDASVAATIYVLWRGRFVTEVLDRHVPGLPASGDFHAMQAVKRLLDDFGARHGVGRSGIDFFAVPGIADAADRRDFLVLKSLGDALTLAAGEAFAPAFGRSADQRDYRWGKLHRITLASPLGAPYSIPSAGNRFQPPLPGLSGVPVDGGANVPDVAGHPLRSDAPEKFTGSLVPARRFVAVATPSGWRSVNALAGGVSEELGSPLEQNLLRGWLANDTYPVG
ncbi:penicillin acylase family protein [Symbioplanes lichenis]|uniref:penicillin acylase family protein n=1 Tax=Symbioplanes lichenis TaxID=1629072 RepID=UPI00273A4085|nr:penicillin acylase family protein [Actinoplanes lichenis]